MNAWENEPTPLTDAAENKQTDGWNTMAHHARELERQLRYARRLLEKWLHVKSMDQHCAVEQKTWDYLEATESEGE